MVNYRSTAIVIIQLVALILSVKSEAISFTDDTSTKIVAPTFHTLQTKVNGNEQLPPIIYLGSDDKLEINFDELADERRYLRYELIHCDAQWHPDRLVAPEYLRGFNEATIDNYAYSEATLQHYVNYSLTIPNDQMQPTVSGNYLIRIYDEDSPDHTILQQRICIVEPTMNVGASVTSRTDIDYNEGHQQLTITVDPRTTAVNNLYSDLIVTIEQNGRQDNVVCLSTPSRVVGDKVIYDHNKQLIFPAGNEYRRMEVVSTSYPGMGVESLSFADPFYHATLYTDLPRADQPYSYDRTQFGRFKIREYDSTDSDVQAEYVIVHFSLEIPEQKGFDIFIDGDLTQRRFSPESLMVYNRASGRYESSMLLKQGAYNYQYLAVGNNGQTIGSTAPIEGNHYQTTNQYIIKTYLRQPGERYDRLTGVTMIETGQ